ncbi:MAG: glucosaminidase domain-containing protein [Fusobacterium sp.]|nr:glucosaminidase domain-containing protein [Fusobacterium sp.]
MRKIFLIGIFICVSFVMNISSYANNNTNKENTLKIEQAKDFKKGKSKKQIFIKSIVPIIDKVRDDIKKEKVYTQMLLAKKKVNKPFDEKEKKFLEEMYAKYKIKSKKINDLVVNMVVPPTSFILGQSALESGWGRSKLAVEGNNLFGMRSVTTDAKIAVKVGKGQYYKRYDNIQDSVEDYILTLARHRSYNKLRKGIRNGENSLQLIKHLANYSEVKNIYAKRLAIIIKKNNFQSYDKKEKN